MTACSHDLDSFSLQVKSLNLLIPLSLTVSFAVNFPISLSPPSLPPSFLPLSPLTPSLSPSFHRAKFIKQLGQLVEKRDTILVSLPLPTQARERKTALEALVLPDTEENLPGVHLEDLR